MVRLAPEIRDVARKYVRLRLANLRGLDLNVFDFDYDLNWVALVLSPEGRVLGRFGGREAPAADRGRTLAGLAHGLSEGLERFRELGAEKPRAGKPRHAEGFAAAQRMSKSACIHCHHVHEFERADAQAAGVWTPAREFRYPEPLLLGFEVDPRQGNRVLRVVAGSPAEAAGLKADDVLSEVNGQAVASLADVQFALDRAPASGRLPLVWKRGASTCKSEVRLAADWKARTDISWRWSLRSLMPEPPVSGSDLSLEEKKALGLTPEQLAFRQGPFLGRTARQAGIQVGDVILGVNDRELLLTAAQFDAHFRLHFKSGDEVTFHILRGKERLRIVVKAP